MKKQIDSFLAACTVMMVSLAEIDVKSARTAFKHHVDACQPFTTKFGIRRQFTSITNRFITSHYRFDTNMSAALREALREALPKFTKDTEITKEQLGYIKDVITFCNKDSDPVWNRFTKNVSGLGDPTITALFGEKEEASVLSTNKKMSAIVVKVTGRLADPILTLNELRDLRESNEDLAKQYSEHLKVFKEAYKNALHNFVRSSGQSTVDVADARKYLHKLGCDYIPKGFVGRIDETGILYTSMGHKINGMLIGEVVMNPKYDPKLDNAYVMSLKANPKQKVYTATRVSQNKEDTFNKVSEFADEIEQHRKTWLRDMRSTDTVKNDLSNMLELLYQTQARVGTIGNKNGDEPTFGMCTIQRKHIKLLKNGITFEYPGKKGTVQHHELHNTRKEHIPIIKFVREQADGKQPTDHLFTHLGGKPILGTELNKYMKSIGIPVTAHKIRHVFGTKLAMEILAKSPYTKRNAPSQSAAEKWFKEALVEVGVALHHRTGSGEKERNVSTTAIASYISPNVSAGWFKKLGLRVPKWVPKSGD